MDPVVKQYRLGLDYAKHERVFLEFNTCISQIKHRSALCVAFFQDLIRFSCPLSFVLLFTYPFAKQALVFTCLQYKSFENTVGKGEIARNEQFLLIPQCFLPILDNFLTF